MIISLYKTFSGNEYVIPSIKSIYDYTDKIIMVHSDISWSGEKGNDVFPVVYEWAKDNDKEGKIVHIHGSWKTQEEQYNVGVNHIANNYDPTWVQIIDTDEVWDEDSVQRLMFNLRHRYDLLEYSVLKCHMFTYIKEPTYRIDPPEPCKPVVAINWGKRYNLSGPRFNASTPAALLGDIVFHHYSFVRRTWEDVEKKIITSHIGDSECDFKVTHVDIPTWKKEKWDKLPNCTSFHPTRGAEHFWVGVKSVSRQEALGEH